MKLTMLALWFNLILICFSAVHAESLKIGLIASLTGPAGEQGRNWVDGALLAQKELKKHDFSVELLIEDDATSPTQAVTAFQKFATVDKVQAVIGGTWDYVAEPLYSLAAQYKIPFITPTNPSEVIPAHELHNPYVFVTGLSVASMMRSFDAFLDREKPTRVTLLYPQVPFGEMQAQAAKSILEHRKILIVGDSGFSPTAYLDVLRSEVLKIKSAKPDLVYIVTNYSGLDDFTKELRRASLTPLIVTSQHLEQAFAQANDKSLYANTYGIYPISIRDNDFNQLFSIEYGHTPHVYSAEGFDAVNFLAEAHKGGINITDPAVEFSFRGVSGIFKLPCAWPSRAPVTTSSVMMTTKNGIFEPENNPL